MNVEIDEDGEIEGLFWITKRLTTLQLWREETKNADRNFSNQGQKDFKL